MADIAECSFEASRCIINLTVGCTLTFGDKAVLAVSRQRWAGLLLLVPRNGRRALWRERGVDTSSRELALLQQQMDHLRREGRSEGLREYLTAH